MVVVVEEVASAVETSATMAAPKDGENLTSDEATVASNALGGTESTCNNTDNNATATSALTSDGDTNKSLELAEELMEKGNQALKDSDYYEAADCFSRALEIRVAHYGELDPKCVKSYYKYGCALLYKAQEEADPLGAVPKKNEESEQESTKDGSVKNVALDETSTASVASNIEKEDSNNNDEEAADDGCSEKDHEEDAKGSDDEELVDADEDESDLDLAWKMLDIARAIAEKDNGDTMEKVDILSALAEVALEREDIQTSLCDYQKALSILDRLVEPDGRQIAELNFRICLCLENGSKPQEAIAYCEKAISVCKSRMLRLRDEVKSASESTIASSASELGQGLQQSSNGLESDNSVIQKQAEIEDLSSLLGELEKKIEDLQQLAMNPKSILSEILGMASAKPRGNDRIVPPAVTSSSQIGSSNSNGDFDSPTVSTAHTNGSAPVTHLGVVGRGVKRVLLNSIAEESSPAKKCDGDKS